MPAIDLNVDAGEGSEHDDELLAICTSVNIACGGHAGDSETMLNAGSLAMGHGVRIGAHPSYPDRENFGRMAYSDSSSSLLLELIGQVSDLIVAMGTLGGKVAYIKPHGALYNDAMSDGNARDVVLAMAQHFALPLMVSATAHFNDPSTALIKEGFIDRTYLADGSLMPRSNPGSLITDPIEAASQAVRLARVADSLCVHSDTPGCVAIARSVRLALEESGYTIGA